MRALDEAQATLAFSPDASAFDAADALVAERIAGLRAAAGRPVLIGLSGPQGSGKTTTAARLRERLEQGGLRTVVLSLDDFYLTREQRAELARTVHPLLATRGVPGTHDVAMMAATLETLAAAAGDQVTPLPTFDKAQDDRAPAADWPAFLGRPDAIVLEGWCVGAGPQAADDLAAPINSLEAVEDADAAWRTYVNDRLATDYSAFFASFDDLIALCAPSFDCVFAWRAEQEAALRLRAPEGARVMTDAELARFIAHYERITRAMIAEPRADLCVEIGPDRRPVSAAWQARGGNRFQTAERSPR